MPNLQRKYIDLIREATSKWVNLDPPIPIEVGTYGYLESETGELRISGNIYDPRFQLELDKLDLHVSMADHPPEEGAVEQDFIVSSKGAKHLDLHLGPEANMPGIAAASIKGQWQFKSGKRDALLIMQSPRLRFIPRNVILDALYKVPVLRDKWLVTNVHVCPAYTMYLSNKSGEKLSLALMAQGPVAGVVAGITAGGEGGFEWWSDMQADMLRKACDQAGNYRYTPLYTMKRRIGWIQKVFRGAPGEEETTHTGDDLWQDALPPWDPLNEDGEQDSVDMDNEEEDPEEF